MVECWKTNKYVYNDLEEMYLVNMNLNQDKEMLAKELGKSLGTGRLAKAILGKSYHAMLHFCQRKGT